MSETTPLMTAADVSAPMNLSLTTKTGHCMGTFVGKYWKKLICCATMVAALIVVIVYILPEYTSGADTNGDETVLESAARYAKYMKHYNCKRSKRGCSSTCPHISVDDPRVMMLHQLSSMETLKTHITESLEATKNIMEEAITTIKGSPSVLESMVKDLERFHEIKKQCVRKISESLKVAQGIYEKYHSSDSITPELISGHNRMSAIEAMMSVYYNTYVAALARSNAHTIQNKIVENTNAEDQNRIDQYDAKVHEINITTAVIDRDYNKCVAIISEGSDFSKSALTITEQTNPTSEAVIAAMAMLLTFSEATRTTVEFVLAKYGMMSETYNKVKSTIESFTNSLPGTLETADINNLISGGNYNQVLIKTALESDVVSNHRKFAKERSTFDSGGGVHSVRDDDNTLIPWAGLFGRPTYQRSDGTSVEVSSEPLRSIPSSNPEDYMRTRRAKISF